MVVISILIGSSSEKIARLIAVERCVVEKNVSLDKGLLQNVIFRTM